MGGVPADEGKYEGRSTKYEVRCARGAGGKWKEGTRLEAASPKGGEMRRLAAVLCKGMGKG